MEEIYQQTKKLFNAADCMVACKDKILIYRKALAGFKQIEDYKDSRQYCKECRKRAKQTRLDIKANAYESALKKLSNAKNARDCDIAKEQFLNLEDYQDAPNMAEKCLQLKAKFEKKSIRGNMMRIMIAVFVVVLFLSFTTTSFKYFRARAYKTAGMYSMAIKLYSKLDTYKDSASRLEECKYYYGLKLKNNQDYSHARQAFAQAHSYQDSDVQEAAVEQLIVQNSNVGKQVIIGGHSWTILDKKENAALLIKNRAIDDITYHNTLENVTWENSDVREFLNGKFMDTFSEEEKNNILMSDVKMDDNEMYQVDGGNDTKDQVFLLSLDEAQQYADIMPKCKVNTWLRSPGSDPKTASFLAEGNIIMEYGYLVNVAGFAIRPAMWYVYE
ncbi:DUF6273 domain-containing protein [[Clostridium] polysaccharolyticum]|uniref:DUF6273 domain-containing protein n=1 Tax=[Clostridium] polysaccharolyticum TaxID=29364 RepID=A0A1I0FG58_9FIRM|nr:DUF6273 domain-containing protein [[Clostridium] polysaccharolyticum]SET56908.1 hypothetical protein SAMN04487772_13121 [[Clostridium] polysaccharolyticum]